MSASTMSSRNPVEFGHDDSELSQFDVASFWTEEKVSGSDDERIKRRVLET